MIPISLEKKGSAVCSDSNCKQEYGLTASSHATAILYLFRKHNAQSSTAAGSAYIAMFDLEKAKATRMKLESFVEHSKQLSEYYNSKNDAEAASKWLRASQKAKELLDELDTILTRLNKKEHTYGDVITLMDLAQNPGAFIDEIKGIITEV
jgi:hypothetical protein